MLPWPPPGKRASGPEAALGRPGLDVDRSDVNLFVELCETASPTGDEAAVGAIVTQRLEALGLSVSEDDAESATLADYVARMKTGQERIYFVVGESLAHCRPRRGALRSSPGF